MSALPPAGVRPVVARPAAYRSGGMVLEAERWEPASPPPAARPGVLVLAGCAGYHADAEVTRAIARAVAELGGIGVRVDVLGVRPAPPGAYCDPVVVLDAAEVLLQAVADSLAALRADPAVDARRVGAAGYSLGAVALAAAQLGGAGLASLPGLGLSALSLLSWPNLLPGVLDGAGRLPPLQVITGALDEGAPPADAHALASAARRAGVPAEVVVVPHQGHPWRGEASVGAAARVAAFLRRHLDRA